MNNSLAVCILSHQIPNPPHLPLICKGDRREALIKVIKRTNLIKSGAGIFFFFRGWGGGVGVCEEKNPGLHLYSQTLREGAISCLIN